MLRRVMESARRCIGICAVHRRAGEHMFVPMPGADSSTDEDAGLPYVSYGVFAEVRASVLLYLRCFLGFGYGLLALSNIVSFSRCVCVCVVSDSQCDL